MAPALVGTGRPPRPSGQADSWWPGEELHDRASVPAFARPWGAAPAGGQLSGFGEVQELHPLQPASPALAGLGRCWYS